MTDVELPDIYSRRQVGLFYQTNIPIAEKTLSIGEAGFFYRRCVDAALLLKGEVVEMVTTEKHFFRGVAPLR
jgi:hypothetical protein